MKDLYKGVIKLDNLEKEIRYDKYDEVDLRELILTLWSYKLLILGLTFVAVVVAFLISNYYLISIYEINSSIQLTNIESLYSNPSAVSQIIQSREIAGNVVKKYYPEYSESQIYNYIENNISLTNDNNSKIIDINVKDSKPARARLIAEGLINSFKERAGIYYQNYISKLGERLMDLRAEIKNIENNIADINENIEKIRSMNIKTIEKSMMVNQEISRLNVMLGQKQEYLNNIYKLEDKVLAVYPIEVLKMSYLPEHPISPNIKLNVAIAGMLALMLSGFIVFFIKFMKGEE